MKCKKCEENCVKNGFQTNGKQKYYCKRCKLHQQESYTYNAYRKDINVLICKLLVNSCGITDISRVLDISKNTVLSRILKMNKTVKPPIVFDNQECYEMDELCTKINGKISWVIFAINRKTKQVIDFVVGSRTKENIAKVVNRLLCLNPKKIYTDGLTLYKTLIPKVIHNNSRYQTNRIERVNLNLRTHLKRLSRKTICYSKNKSVLSAILKIYFWGLNYQSIIKPYH